MLQRIKGTREAENVLHVGDPDILQDFVRLSKRHWIGKGHSMMYFVYF